MTTRSRLARSVADDAARADDDLGREPGAGLDRRARRRRRGSAPVDASDRDGTGEQVPVALQIALGRRVLVPVAGVADRLRCARRRGARGCRPGGSSPILPSRGRRATRRGESTCTPVNMQACAPGRPWPMMPVTRPASSTSMAPHLAASGTSRTHHRGGGVGCVVTDATSAPMSMSLTILPLTTTNESRPPVVSQSASLAMPPPVPRISAPRSSGSRRRARRG